jgi:hypothetical protein
VARRTPDRVVADSRLVARLLVEPTDEGSAHS